MSRRSGFSAPLFALVTDDSWGVGEFRDLAVFARWASEAGQALVQILPVMELPAGERSPYTALSSMALDPTAIALPAVPDFDGIGGDLAFAAEDRLLLEDVRRSPRIDYDNVRRLKDRWLRRSFERFQRLEHARGSPRARRFDAFVAAESWWLEDYSHFRALLALHEDRAWWHWPEVHKRGDTASISAATRQVHNEASYRQYLQWIAAEQWAEARRLSWPARIIGDLPFAISGNSADVWRRQSQFRLDATVGAPPDAFAEEGQDWGMPPWRWSSMVETRFEWMRQRARRQAHLFDGFRIDHLVGLYRTWIRPIDKTRSPFFDPPAEAEQRAIGETVVRLLKDTGAELIAEDLGTVPPFVRASIAALGVPGLKVLRWERHYDRPGHPPIDPATFPPLSVATTGTHDIDPLARSMSGAEVERAIEALLRAGSDLTLLPLQDVFAWRDRINTPGVISDANWTWKVPTPVDRWLDWDVAVARMERMRALTRAAGR